MDEAYEALVCRIDALEGQAERDREKIERLTLLLQANKDLPYIYAEASLRATGMVLSGIIDLLDAHGALDRTAFDYLRNLHLSQIDPSVDPNENAFGCLMRALLEGRPPHGDE